MIRQYVNLDPSDDDEHHGPDLALTADASQIGSDEIVRSEWWIDPLTQNQDERYLSRRQRAHLRLNYPVNEDQAFHNTVTLPHVGGDCYDVLCSKRHDRSQSHRFGTIETWRKLYFSVWLMNDECETQFDQTHSVIDAEMARSFIEFEEIARARTLVSEETTTYRDALRFLYQSESSPSVLEHKPFHLRIVFINHLFNPSHPTHRGTASDSTLTQTTVDQLPATEWLASGRIKLNRPGEQWRTVTEASDLVSRTGDFTFQVDVSSLPEYWAEGEYDGSWQYELHLNTLRNLAGGNIGNLSIVSLNGGNGAYSVFQSSCVQLHEMGHSCGQVVRRERTYNASGGATGWESHPTWYTDNYGGMGNHCSHHAHLAPSTRTSSDQAYEPNSGATVCVMYHRISDEHGTRFCPNCLSRLQRANLGRRAMIRRGWNRF